jgi:ATP-dependent Lhr-like helicase
MLGEIGEKIAFGRDFYAIFPSDEEWRLIHGGRQLGTIPISNILGIGSLVAFAGRRWRVIAVDDTAKVLTIEPHKSAQIPKFEDPSLEPIHDNLAARMKAVLMGTDIPPYLDQTAQELLVEGRTAFQEMNLASEILVQAQKDTHLLLWHGAAMNSVFAVALSSAGFECSASDIGVTVAKATPDDVRAVLKVLATNPLSVEDVADFVQNLQVAKYDELIPTALLRNLWARANAETVERVAELAKRLIGTIELSDCLKM